VVAGHICLDIIPDLSRGTVQGAQFFVPGKLAEIGPATLSTGGPVSNTGLALLLLGIPTALMGKVGDDHFGLMVRRLLEQRGAGEGLIVLPGDTTSYTIALSPPGFDRMFLHDPAANNTFCAADIHYDLVAQASLFHLGYPPLMRRLFADEGRELAEIFARVKQLGVTTSLDMSLPDPHAPGGQADWHAILGRVMPYVDIFLPSAEETLYMLDRPRFERYLATGAGNMLSQFMGEDLTRLSDALLDMGGKIIGIKCGERGFYLRTAGVTRLHDMGRAKPQSLAGWADREVWEPSFHVTNYAGATGSGDSAIAGFLVAYLRGHALEQCLRYACAVGGFNVTAPDALSGLRTWEETVAAVQLGWAKNPLPLADSGWYCDASQLWHGPRDIKREQDPQT
jgi:sugar/nucleoside kinase (ribokinase family)